MSDTFICDHCQEEYPRSALRIFDGQNLCTACRDELTTLCYRCGERIWNHDDFGDNNISLCEFCRDNDYSYCSQCGRLVPNDELYYLDDDNDEGCCERCYCCHHPNQGIQSYYYKPDPIFYGDGKRYFGVELEIDEGGERDEHARKLIHIANTGSQDRLYVKHDGSLNDGFELVSHPMAPDYHR